ncbi:MAG: hypothetical protein RBS24_00035 [Bacilli bacterium]|nr:hypothetical protein [Bacilli bacterium]
MTSKEALENIKNNYPLVHLTNYKLIKESFEVLEQLVDRDTPTPPIKLYWKNTENYYYVCPKCEEDVVRMDEVFCQDCGQWLDWSE